MIRDARETETMESFQRERRRGWLFVVVVIDDTFLVNNENFCRRNSRITQKQL